MPNTAHLEEAGRANLRIMADERIRERLGISRQTATQSFNKALRKFEARRPLKQREGEVLKVFGLSMMWQFSFNDRVLLLDFQDLLVEEGSLAVEDTPSFGSAATYITLYAINIMHGARLKLADGKMAQLRVASSEESGFLRIKAEISVSDTPKPITTSVPMFETTLMASDHCDPELLNSFAEPIPAEIDGERLVPFL